MAYHLDSPFDHVDPLSEGSFTWQRLFIHRDDFPLISGEGRRVCVVGGGISGLVAAYELQRRDFRVTVIEALDRCGGRISTHYFPDGSYGELGAMRIPVMHAAAIDYVDEFDLPTRPFIYTNPAGRFYFNGVAGTIGRPSVSASGAVFDCYSALRKAFPDLDRVTTTHLEGGPRKLLMELLVNPLQAEISNDAVKWALFLSASNGGIIDEFRTTRLVDYGHALGLSGDDWEFLSRATGIACLEECSVAQFILDMFPTIMSSSMVEIVGGMELLPAAFVRHLRGERVLTASTVDRVELCDSGASVCWQEKDATKFREVFDFVVLAIPPIALRNVTLVSSSMDRSKDEAIRRTEMGPLAKTLIRFNERFWEQEPSSIYGGLSFTNLESQQCWYPSDNGRGFHDLTGRVSYRAVHPDNVYGPGVLTASYRWGSGARQFSRLSDGERTSRALSDLALIHDMDMAKISSLVDGEVHKFWPGGFTILDNNDYHRDLGLPLLDHASTRRVFFAGEHVGAVHGWLISAIVSALSAVREILSTAATRK